MIKILIETIAEVVAKNQSQTEEILKWIKAQPEQSDAWQYISNRLDAIDMSVQEVPNKIAMPRAEIAALKKELRAHIEQLAIPLKQEVKHEHHIVNSIAGFVVAFLVIIGLSFLSCYAWMQADLHKQNDIKYRFIQAYAAPDQRKALDGIDSDYNESPARFTKSVLDREKIVQDSFQDYRLEQEKQQDIYNIHKKWNR